MKKLLLVSLCFLVLCVTQVFAQNRTVTGTVTAKDDGLPIPGVTVKIKGHAGGVPTDVNGKYSIPVPAGSTLVFSFISYLTQEVPVGERSVINVSLSEDTKQLNEVVVTTFGVVRQAKSLAYNISKVTNEQITQKSEPDVLKALEGKVAGVDIRTSNGTPGAATRIQIRGNTSFVGSNEPLIVVDGVPYSNDVVTTTSMVSGGGAYSSGISNIDPNDIATINVEKGASAAALYGSRASNGVVIITTKSGSSSRSHKGFEVTYKTSYSAETVSNLPDYQNLYGAGSQFGYSNSNGSWGPKFGDIATIPTWADYLPYFNNAATIPYKAVPNNVKDLFRTGNVYENSVNISAGDEKASINATASQLNNNGYIPNSSFDRSSIGLGGAAKLDNGLNIHSNLSYTRSTQSGGYFGENQVDGVPSEFARTLYLARNWDIAGLPFEDAAGNSLTPNGGGQFDNPRWSEKYNTINSAEERFIANIKLDHDITKLFNLSFQIGTNIDQLARREVIEVGSRAAQGLGSLKLDAYRHSEIESTTLFSLKQQKAADFTFDGFVGFNFNQRTETENVENGNIYNIKGLHTLTNTVQQQFLADGYDRKRIMGVLGDLTVGYKDYLFLTATGRNDWSSTLPVENRSYFYPSASLSFIFSDAFNLKNDWFDYGKLRGSYARVGNDTGPYQTSNYFGLGNPFLGQPTASTPSQNANLNLQPEFTREFEVGTELSFFNDRVNLDLAIYDKKSTNLIVPVPAAPASGFGSFVTNAGVVSNKGFEVEATFKPIKTKDFSWAISGNFSHNQNTVVAITDAVKLLGLGTGVLTTIGTYGEAGKPYGFLYGTVNYRDSKGNLVINPTNGNLIEAPTQQMIGNPNPKGKGAITNVFKYKGFTLEAQIDATFGGDLYSETVNSLLGRGVTKDTQDRQHTWIIPGVYGDPNTGQPILINGAEVPNTTRVTTNDLYFASGGNSETFAINAASEWSVYDATVYRLREVTLGYNLPKKWIQKLPIGSLSLSVTGRNLWFYAPGMPKYSNFDPEVNSIGAGTTQGIDLSAAPTTKRYGINLLVTF
ncbi:SusC/RagA family TonB-linked outer membrane protein [Mucilaginibacter sp. dw_454]|uniref:SusC/RagA family TonB-linked outer membrane protein n=1 Tax=Mucilaginibacter sp. dw_454 TaxID=2720079 RepID=UPI001BD599A5|nr:SusC/RagA family TonB-linked outer membrane protein [Mucilaginibacter sp. dw_454]